MTLEIDLCGKTALVTGASDGIGAGVATELARAGCRVVGCGLEDPDAEGPRHFVDTVREVGSDALYVQADVCKRPEIERLVSKALNHFAALDIAVSNAGAAVFKGLLGCSEEDWAHNLNLNLNSHWRLGQQVHPHLAHRGEGVFIVMGSNHAYSTIPGCSPYSVAKAGLLGMVQSMAIEWGPALRVIGVAPGFIETRQNEAWFASFPDAAAERQRTIDRHPAGKLGTPAEIGGFCAFLASSYAAFATGTTYLVDGGRSALMQDGG